MQYTATADMLLFCWYKACSTATADMLLFCWYKACSTATAANIGCQPGNETGMVEASLFLATQVVYHKQALWEFHAWASVIQPILCFNNMCKLHSCNWLVAMLCTNGSTVYSPQSHAGLGIIPSAAQHLNLPTFTTSGGGCTSTTSMILPLSSTGGILRHTTPGDELCMSSFQDLPPKLVKRILSLEFVDMSELIPGSWKLTEDNSPCCQHTRAPSKGPVTDILLWIECYSTMVAVLASRFPDKVPQLMTYQKTIVKAHRTYAGHAWVTYDLAYRRRAANLKSLDWGAIDFNLYTETFACRGKAIPRCKFCSSDLHTSDECEHTYNLNQSSSQSTRQFPPKGIEQATPICFKFNSDNQNKCRLKWCRYAHICSDCQGRHPRSSCPLRRLSNQSRLRAKSPPPGR